MIDLHPTPTLRQPRITVPVSGQCRAKPPCGTRCCLDATTPHELHICREPDCDWCHSRERYEGGVDL
jgi:hypothetical protein